MDPKYAKWIESNYPTRLVALARCSWATKKMVEEFPELERVPGHVLTAHGGVCEHWWCKTSDGEIVDPTLAQYEMGVIEYRPWKPGIPRRAGRCLNCGADIYDINEETGEPMYSASVCDAECEAAFAAYLNDERKKSCSKKV